MNLLKDRLSRYFEPRGTQSAFKRKTGFFPSQIARWLDGTSEPSLETLDRIADAMDIEPWELIKPDSDVVDQSPNRRRFLEVASALNDDELPMFTILMQNSLDVSRYEAEASAMAGDKNDKPRKNGK